MPRFFLDVPPQDGIITVTGEDAKHIGYSLRCRVGDELVFCCGGTDYDAKITAMTADSVLCEVISSEPSPGEPKTDLTLYCGLPKSDRAELIVQKCTELGARRIVFFEGARSVAKFGRNFDTKLRRLSKIAHEAAMQCGRGAVPTVEICPDTKTAVDMLCTAELPLICYEKQETRSVSLLSLSERLTAAGSVAVMTGPEGGFEEKEADDAVSRGAVPIWLGHRILRCETAPAAAAAIIMSICGEM